MDIWQSIFYVVSFVMVLTVLLPLIKNEYWTFRIFDYPRFQKLSIISFLLVIGFIFFFDAKSWSIYLVLGILLMCFGYLAYLVVPYTFFGKKMLLKADDKERNQQLTFLVINIYQDNTNYKKTLDLIKIKNAEVVFLVETNAGWMDAVQEIKEDYPYFIEVPQENTYGLLLYSKIPFVNEQVRFLVDKEVPSVVVDLNFHGRTIKLFGLHPTPPVPQENSESTDRDAEILIVGKEAKKCQVPVIVLGDLNDVAWSYTTKLFLRVSGLLDPRRGRGMFNTFHANYWFLRWPLDHFFVSSHFRLLHMKVEQPVGSDHFPISISLALSQEDKEKELEATLEHKEIAEEKIDKASE